MERLVREVRKVAFASEPGVTQSGAGDGTRWIGDMEKNVEAARHRVAELGSLCASHLCSYTQPFLPNCPVQAWPFSISVSF